MKIFSIDNETLALYLLNGHCSYSSVISSIFLSFFRLCLLISVHIRLNPWVFLTCKAVQHRFSHNPR